MADKSFAQLSRDLAAIVNTEPLSISKNRIVFSRAVSSLGDNLKSMEQVFGVLKKYPNTLKMAEETWKNVRSGRKDEKQP